MTLREWLIIGRGALYRNAQKSLMTFADFEKVIGPVYAAPLEIDRILQISATDKSR